MRVEIDPSWLITIFLLSIRVGTLLFMTPIFSGLGGALTLRVLFTFALSTTIVSGMAVTPSNAPLTLGPLLSGALSEIFIGSTLAFGLFAAFGAFAVAGKILDVQSGLGLGTVFDPVNRKESPLFSTILTLLAVTVFFGMDAHLAFLRGVAFSVRQCPPGSGMSMLTVEAVVRQFGLMFSLGTALIAPVMFCLLLAETGFAIMSRFLPQMNVFVINIPIKLFITFGTLALTIGTLAPTMARVYASIFTFWEKVLS